VPARDLCRNPIGVLVVDDDPRVGTDLQAFFENDGRLALVGVAPGLEPALNAATALPVEVALVTERLAAGDGLGIVGAMTKLVPGIVSIVMSSVDQPEVLLSAVAVGAAAVIRKSDFVHGACDLIVSTFEHRRAPVPADAPGATPGATRPVGR
jgi:DNA-binding NarL/FixJ family response regulator